MPRSNLAQMARRKQQTRLNFESAHGISSPIQSSATKVKNDPSDDSATISLDLYEKGISTKKEYVESLRDGFYGLMKLIELSIKRVI